LQKRLYFAGTCLSSKGPGIPPEVTSRSRDVNKHGDGVNEFTPLLKCKLGLMDKYIFLFDLNDIKIILIDLIIMQITFIDM